MSNFIKETLKPPVIADADVVVMGGGTAEVTAAIA